MICETKRNSSLKKHLTAIKFTELRKPKVVSSYTSIIYFYNRFFSVICIHFCPLSVLYNPTIPAVFITFLQVTISGKRLPNEPMFVLLEMGSDGGVNKSYGAVEVMALRYYKQQGYNEGIHGEGITFNTLFGLLMWDVIFSDSVPDVFRTPFQVGISKLLYTW